MSDTNQTNPNPLAEAISQLAQVQKAMLDGLEEIVHRLDLTDRYLVELSKSIKKLSANQQTLGENESNLAAELRAQREAIHHILNGGKPPRPGRPELMN